MKRIVPGLALAACWLILLLSGSFILFWAIVIILSCVAGYEYLKMTVSNEVGRSERWLLTVAISLPVFLAGVWLEAGVCGGLFLAFFLCSLYVLSHFSRLDDALSVLGKLGLGTVYVGFLIAHLILIHHLPEGNFWLIILVAITAGSDSGAYYCGKTFGRRKLCLSVSPNKTIEGAVGGVICGVVVALLFAALLLESVNWLMLIPAAVVLSGVGIIGDLCESIIKRGTNTKDSGRILLDHGGVLDRIDSMILAAPTLYYLYIFTG